MARKRFVRDFMQVQDYFLMIHSIIHKLKYIPNGLTHEDLFQVGCLSLWKSLDKYDPERYGHETTYFYKVVERDLIDYLRHVYKGECLNSEFTIDEEIPFEDEIIGNSIIEEIERLVGALNANMFIDRHLNGMSIHEMVDKYKLPKSTLTRRLRVIQETLAKTLKWEN